MSVLAIDIGVVNTSVCVQDEEGSVIFHSLFSPDTKGLWLNDLTHHISRAKFIGVEKQVAANSAARKLMKQVLWFILDSKKRDDCVWGTVSPNLKTPESSLCKGLFPGCQNTKCVLGKEFHNDRDTKTWAVGRAGHILLQKGQHPHNPIFSSKKKDDLADTVLYCEMMRSGCPIVSCDKSDVRKLISKDLSGEIPLSLVQRMSIALL